MDTRKPPPILRGTTELAATLIEFGEPVLEILPSRPEEGEVREAVELLVSVWNAHALAAPAWGTQEPLQQIEAIADSADSPHFLVRVLKVLSDRKKTRFGADNRVAEQWEIAGDGRSYLLRCEERAPIRS
ncbi:MAG: hypothetical protein JNK04_02245 [Myxococcales bacterium]|nr:hypothetical protein [Myxococcales bacterium]